MENDRCEASEDQPHWSGHLLLQPRLGNKHPPLLHYQPHHSDFLCTNGLRDGHNLRFSLTTSISLSDQNPRTFSTDIRCKLKGHTEFYLSPSLMPILVGCASSSLQKLWGSGIVSEYSGSGIVSHIKRFLFFPHLILNSLALIGEVCWKKPLVFDSWNIRTTQFNKCPWVKCGYLNCMKDAYPWLSSLHLKNSHS